MSFFSSVLSKLGIGSAEAAENPVQQSSDTSQGADTAQGAATQQAIPVVDVVAKLEAMAANHAEQLNWQQSIVDLLKVLGLDSSLAARKELAAELGCPADAMGDSARMNIWLHKAVLQKLAENGGNIPQALLD